MEFAQHTEQWNKGNQEGWDNPSIFNRAFRIEKHVGCDPWPVEAGPAYHNVVTTYYEGVRTQTIRLESKLPTIAQQLKGSGRKVEVHWSVWIAPRFDCGSEFTATLSWNNGSEKEIFELAHVELQEGGPWRKLEKVVVLKGCVDGVFEYEEKGKDTRFLAGYYGVKILNPSIIVKFK